MKETEIAKQMLETYNLTKDDIDRFIMIMHKETCQREVIWLKEFMINLEIANDQVPESNYKFWDYMKQLRIRHYNRDTDLKQAIKLYDEAGI